MDRPKYRKILEEKPVAGVKDFSRIIASGFTHSDAEIQTFFKKNS